MQKQNTEHALMTEADAGGSLQLVIDQGHGTTIWRAAMLTNQYAFDALLPTVEMCQTFINDSHYTSSELSLSCGSNAGMLQRNHPRPRLHWMHTQHAMHPCIQTYPSCCRCSSLYPSPLLRQSIPVPPSNG